MYSENVVEKCAVAVSIGACQQKCAVAVSIVASQQKCAVAVSIGASQHLAEDTEKRRKLKSTWPIARRFGQLLTVSHESDQRKNTHVTSV